MEPVRAQYALTVRRRAAFGVADVVLGIVWMVVSPRLPLPLPARLVVLAAAQALVAWGFVECVRGWRLAGNAVRVVATLAAVLAVLASLIVLLSFVVAFSS